MKALQGKFAVGDRVAWPHWLGPSRRYGIIARLDYFEAEVHGYGDDLGAMVSLAALDRLEGSVRVYRAPSRFRIDQLVLWTGPVVQGRVIEVWGEVPHQLVTVYLNQGEKVVRPENEFEPVSEEEEPEGYFAPGLPGLPAADSSIVDAMREIASMSPWQVGWYKIPPAPDITSIEIPPEIRVPLHEGKPPLGMPEVELDFGSPDYLETFDDDKEREGYHAGLVMSMDLIKALPGYWGENEGAWGMRRAVDTIEKHRKAEFGED